MKLLHYIKGLRKGKEAHRIEKEAMKDPFLADALDGFDEVDANHAERIERMQRRITQLTDKDRLTASAKVAAKRAALYSEAAIEEPACAEISMDEEKAASVKKELPATEKKRSRNLAVWLAAAILLLFITTGGYFWLIKQNDTVPQLAVTTKSTSDQKEVTDYNKTSETEESVTGELQNDGVIAHLRENIQSGEEQSQAVQQQTQPTAPSFPLPVITEDEIAETAIRESIASDAFENRLSLNTEIDSILNFNNFRLNDTVSSNLLAFKDIGKLQEDLGYEVIKSDEILGIHSNTNRSALTDKMGAAKKRSNKQNQYDPHALSPSQINSQGKIGGKLAGQNQEFSRADRQRYAASSTSASQPSEIAGVTVKGRIIDQYGEPIPFVTIKAQKSNSTTTTDTEGYFAINAKNAEKLVASYIGFDELEISADTSKTMTIAMKESAMHLDEMVVTGYGVNRSDDYSTKYETVMPKPQSGYSTYRKYINDNMVKPTDECANVSGRVVLTFYVNSSGRPYNIEVRKSLCSSADKEAIRLLQEGESWTTGDGQVRLTVKF